MSDAAAGAALVVEQVLLYDASLLTIGRKRVAAAEFLINESLYPNINGSHRGTAIAKEADAVCYLFADAVQLEEAGKGERRRAALPEHRGRVCRWKPVRQRSGCNGCGSPDHSPSAALQRGRRAAAGWGRGRLHRLRH